MFGKVIDLVLDCKETEQMMKRMNIFNKAAQISYNSINLNAERLYKLDSLSTQTYLVGSTQNYQNSNHYTGLIVNGKKKELGRYVWENGDRYLGLF